MLYTPFWKGSKRAHMGSPPYAYKGAPKWSYNTYGIIWGYVHLGHMYRESRSNGIHGGKGGVHT